MSKDKVWVSRSMMDSSLIKSFEISTTESEITKFVEGIRENEAGKAVAQDKFPAEVYHKVPSRNHKKLPDFCMAGNFVVSEAVADVLRQFDIGHGALYPLRVLQHDRETPVEGSYYNLNFGNTKTAFLPEMSECIRKPYDHSDIWKLTLTPIKADAIAVSENALKGPDIWIDTRFVRAFFLSDRLVQALKPAKLTRSFRLFRCRVIKDH